MSDLIRRSDAIKALYKYSFVSKDVIEREINAIPSADRPKSVDLTNVYQTAYDNGYARGKADRPRGEWIDKGKNLWKCSNCEMVIYSESEQDRNEFHKWCSRCGARMKRSRR